MDRIADAAALLGARDDTVRGGWTAGGRHTPRGTVVPTGDRPAG
jgi:hypothetical protein